MPLTFAHLFLRLARVTIFITHQTQFPSLDSPQRSRDPAHSSSTDLRGFYRQSAALVLIPCLPPYSSLFFSSALLRNTVETVYLHPADLLVLHDLRQVCAVQMHQGAGSAQRHKWNPNHCDRKLRARLHNHGPQIPSPVFMLHTTNDYPDNHVDRHHKVRVANYPIKTTSHHQIPS